MQLLKKFHLTATASLFSATLAMTSLLSISSASAGGSGVDLDRYCKDQYGTNGRQAWAQLMGGGVYDWKCAQQSSGGAVTYYPISMGHVCSVQHGTWSHGHHGTPYSWYCG